ncbi:MAG: 50S ribosomal protein L21 [Bacteroidales bacterium]|nr:50S ribosomal protein L21 [Bacteroidales bacterium]
MYAIVEIAGQQFKAETGKKIFVHRLEAEKESDLEFDRVLLVEDGGKVIVGEPVVKDFIVAGHVLDHVKGDKVIVFKKKRKKGYRVKNGHRQSFTQIEITGIGEKGKIVKQAPKKVSKKAPEPAVEEGVAAEKKPAAKKSSSKKAAEVTDIAGKTKAKKAPAKKETEKKPATKKASKSKE